MENSSTPTPASVTKQASKTYKTTIPNSTFIAQRFTADGAPIAGQVDILQFHGDSLIVEDVRHMKQLDAIANTSGCPIYTDAAGAVAAKAGSQEPFSEVKKRAAEVVEQIAKAGQHA